MDVVLTKINILKTLTLHHTVLYAYRYVLAGFKK